MASRLLCRPRKVVAYLPSLRDAVKHFRSFSSYNEESYSSYSVTNSTTPITDHQTVWPDKKFGPLGPKDKRFPLPGYVGTCTKSQPATPVPVFGQIPSERHSDIVQQFLSTAEQVERSDEEGFLPDDPTPSAADMLECVAYECPEIIRKDLADLMPDFNIMTGTFTVITISQRTQNDMSGWSPVVEDEREQLLECFIQGAQDICEALKDAGFWADFIDPSCGKPYLGPQTNATLFETDERYRKFGFEINDLGCCKVVSHHLWGTHAYIGCLFTNAPLDHPVIQVMRKTNKD